MKKRKAFDCVRLKDEIQARLLRQWKGLSDAQIRTAIERELQTSDSPIARLWRSLPAPVSSSKP